MARHALPNLSWDESHSIETDHVTVRSQHRLNRWRTNREFRGHDGVVGATEGAAFQTGSANSMHAHTHNRLAMLGAAAMMLAAATPAAAQKTGIGFGGSIGANVPNGEFADGVKTGLVANGFVGLGTGRFGLRGELLWSRSDLDNAFIRKVGNQVLPSDGVGEVTGNVNMVGASANLVLPLTQSMVRPYVIGGVGVYRR